jgi:hypothetical protein
MSMRTSDLLACEVKRPAQGAKYSISICYVSSVKQRAARSNVIPTTRLHFSIRLELQLGCCEPVRLHLCFALLFDNARTTTANGRGRDAGGAGTHIVTEVSPAILRSGHSQLFTAVRRACVLDGPCAPCRPGFCQVWSCLDDLVCCKLTGLAIYCALLCSRCSDPWTWYGPCS